MWRKNRCPAPPRIETSPRLAYAQRAHTHTHILTHTYTHPHTHTHTHIKIAVCVRRYSHTHTHTRARTHSHSEGLPPPDRAGFRSGHCQAVECETSTCEHVIIWRSPPVRLALLWEPVLFANWRNNCCIYSRARLTYPRCFLSDYIAILKQSFVNIKISIPNNEAVNFNLPPLIDFCFGFIQETLLQSKGTSSHSQFRN